MALLSTYKLEIGYREKNEKKSLQKNITVGIDQGQIISLIGQNGVGKTTFIKTLSSLIPALGGEIFYGEFPLRELSNNALATRLSIVLTDKPSNGNLTVKELIALGRHPYSSWLGILSTEDKRAIQEAIDRTRINYLVNKKLFQLSDGQLQKVMIARALAQQTPLIFLDEPTAHLDLHNKIEIMLLLKEIATDGKGILISTHDLQLSTQLSDYLWLFNFNQDVIAGVAEDLVLNGKLSETLYLSENEYDLKHGTIHLPAHGKKIRLEGDEDLKFWTKRALGRQGFQISDQAEMKIKISDSKWFIGDHMAESIEELLLLIEKIE